MLQTRFRNIQKLTFISCALILALASSAQNYLSVPFNSGFIGRVGNNSGQADTVLNFSTLGLSNAYFIQNSSVGTFEIQGNDISGTIRLVSNSGSVLDVDGAIVWRENSGQTILLFGFIPSSSVPQVDLASIGTGVNYIIDTESNYGLIPNGGTYTVADSSSVNGNAATNGLLDALNTYLATVQTNQPTGPVSANDLTTDDDTPTLTGQVTLAAGESFAVIVDGVSYDTTSGVTIVGTDWSLTLGTTSPGSYDVTAVISDPSGYTLSSLGTLTITADNQAPVITSGTTGTDLAENSGAGQTVYTITATDDVAVTGYAIGGADAGLLTVNSSTGVVTLTADPDYESKSSYSFTVTASDGANNTSAETTVTFSITNVVCEDVSACNFGDASNPCTYATTWYADTDSDGFGDAASSQSACTQPAGYVSNSTDCDDTNISINALDACGVCGGSGPSTWYADVDADGAGDPATTQSACTQPAGYVAVAGDGCPSDPNKTAAGICGCGVVDVDIDSDGVCDSSDNCTNLSACNYDGSVNNVACTFATTWYADTDSDGFGDAASSQSACTQPAGYVSNSTDCDDTDISINAFDACGVCGGSGPSTWYADADGDGLGDSSDSQSACAQPAGYVANSSDLCDDNTACNYDANSVANAACTYATTWYADTDSDGFGDAASSQSAC
ncbi:MAG: cadherin domain-containing protein, partial [Flavobacteriales bacterium]